MKLCDQCRNWQFAFDSIRAPFLYQDEIARLMLRAKFKAGLTGLALVSELCTGQVMLASEMPEILIPVPLAWRRMVERGFNQSALIARHYGHRLGIPVRHDLLRRKRHTRAQSGLSRRARLKNLVGAFEAHGDLKGKTAALVDDVLTTGATVLAASKALKKAGAGKVIVWVCARTPAP